VTVLHGDNIFKEFVVDFAGTGKSVTEINAALLERGILGGHDLGEGRALYCVTEVISEDDARELVAALTEVLA
jgi:glycine dehydrogenase subunit 1